MKPFERFAALVERNWEGIAAYCTAEEKISLGFVEAAAEATEEAILNALTMATTMVGRDGHRVEAISLTRLRNILDHQAK